MVAKQVVLVPTSGPDHELLRFRPKSNCFTRKSPVLQWDINVF